MMQSFLASGETGINTEQGIEMLTLFTFLLKFLNAKPLLGNISKICLNICVEATRQNVNNAMYWFTEEIEVLTDSGIKQL